MAHFEGLAHVAESSTTTGISDWEPAGAVDDSRTFASVLSNGDTVAVSAYLVTGGGLEWEDAICTYNSGTGRLERTTVLESSNANAKVSFSAGTKTLVCTPLAKRYREFAAALQGHLFGLTLSNSSADSDTDHDIGIAAGSAASDSAIPLLMSLSSAIYKKLDATFAEGTGNGGMVSGESLPTSGTIHVWLIMKADGTTDVCANNHASSGLSPTLPSGFTYKRRILSLRTDSSGNILPFVQHGDYIALNPPVNSADNVSVGTSVISQSLAVPAGLEIEAHVAVQLLLSSAPAGAVVFDGTLDDQTYNSPVGNQTIRTNGAGEVTAQTMFRRTNTSSQIKIVAETSASKFYMVVLGWRDTRGRLA
ncbi:MAG: hypothetical protein Rhirs2KO_18570 [Rhizobiaceae bacterium]